jgi:hypothetical protein
MITYKMPFYPIRLSERMHGEQRACKPRMNYNIVVGELKI